MWRKQLKWILAFVLLAILAGYVGSGMLNSGKGAKLAVETLRQNYHETGLQDPKVVKLKSVSEVGGIEARYYAISFKDSRGENRRAEIKCIRGKDKFVCIELVAKGDAAN